MCLSAYWQWKLANGRARISAVIGESQIAPSLSQICVWSTLTMSSFELEAREEYTGHENLKAFTTTANPRSKNSSMAPSVRSDFAQVSPLLSSFYRFWTNVIEIEAMNEEDCSFLSLLYCYCVQQHISLAFCIDFNDLNHTIYRCSHPDSARAKYGYSCGWRHGPTRPVLSYSSVVDIEKATLWTLKVPRKLTKMATKIIFFAVMIRKTRRFI